MIYPRCIKPAEQESKCPLDNGRHDFSLQPDSPDLGGLALPLEVMEVILKHLDIPSLTTFRRVSKRARIMVDSTFEYKEVMSQAPNIIRGALALGMRNYTLHDVYITILQATKSRPGIEYLFHSQCDHICMTTCERICRYSPASTAKWQPIMTFDKGLASRFFGQWAGISGVGTKVQASISTNELLVEHSSGCCTFYV